MRVICYNQYPGLYENINTMREDLPRIANLGFKQVWINPIYTPCQENFIPNMAHRIHCPYAMKDRNISPRYAANEQEIKNYTQAASDLNMIPMFDLVARHVAIDHEMVSENPTWFRRHPNGNLMMHNMDENYNPTDHNPWCDIACFNYDDPTIVDEIFTSFWEPFLRYNIVKLGFKGIRLDAPLMIPPHIIKRLLDTAKKLCLERHGQEPIVLAETVGIGDKNIILGFKGCGITHAMNSVYWMPGPLGTQEHDYSLWQMDHNWYTENKGFLQQIGKTVSYAGSHDEERVANKIKKLLSDNSAEFGEGDKNDNQKLIQLVKEEFLKAFSSDGGWVFLYGDEFGVLEKVNLFDTTPKEYHKKKSLQLFDFSDYIRAINRTLEQLPSPVFPEWQQRIFLDSFKECVIFLTHQGEGFSGESYLVIANASNEKRFLVTDEILKEIMLANGRNEASEKLPQSIFLCGEGFEFSLGSSSEFNKIPIYHCLSDGVILKNKAVNLSNSYNDLNCAFFGTSADINAGNTGDNFVITDSIAQTNQPEQMTSS